MTQHRDSGLQSWQDYVDFLRRRKRQIIIPFLVIFAVASAIAYLLPPVYYSTSTTLIELQQVPKDLIRTTATGHAGQGFMQDRPMSTFRPRSSPLK